MLLKVCGINQAADVAALTNLGVDMIGLIFYARSPRFCGGNKALKEAVRKSHSLKKAGVFADAPLAEILSVKNDFHLDAIQLHGAENPDLCSQLRPQATVIKAFGIHGLFDFDRLKAYADVVDYFLFDTRTSRKGGSGQPFDWRLLDKYRLPVPFILSGGIGPENIGNALRICHPQLAGIDINSRAETMPGVKDLNKIKLIVDEIHNR